MLVEAPGKLLEGSHRLQNVLLGLLAKAGQAAQLLVPRQLGNVGHRFHFELLPEQRNFFRPEPLQAQHVEDFRRELLQQFLVGAEFPGPKDFANVLLHPFADAGHFPQPFLFDQLRHRLCQGFDLLRGALVAAVAADLRALHFQQLRCLAQNSGNVPVRHRFLAGNQSGMGEFYS